MDWITRMWTKVWNFVLCLHPRSLFFLLLLQCFVTKVSKIIQIAAVLPLSWRTSYVIYPLSVDLGPPFVDHAGHFSSACPISCLLKPFVSCSNQNSIVQGSFPHWCGQNVYCGHLMRMWQFLLELLLHQAPMFDLLYLSFFLGCSVRLPLMACRSSLLWSRSAKNKIVLNGASWQFGLSSFALGHFFFLDVGLGSSIKWVGVAKFFNPIVYIFRVWRVYW